MGRLQKSTKTRKAKWLFVCVLVALGSVVFSTSSQAALVDLDSFVEFAILDLGASDLSDGSVIYIIGSGDANNDGMYSHGGDLVANSTQGDDVILGIIRIGDGVDPNTGTFDVTVQFENDDIDYVYIRFFDWQGNDTRIDGSVDWGTSTVIAIPAPVFGVSEVQYDSLGQLQIQNTDTFTVIPEPGALNLMALFFVMLIGARSRLKLDRKNKINPDAGISNSDS